MSQHQTIKRSLKKLGAVKTWQLLLILVVGLFVAATFLRLNNIGMIQRREAVLSADEQLDKEVLQNRLYDLQRYSAAHMNASSGAIYLQESYDQAWQQIQKAAEENNNQTTQNIYKKIDEEICGPLAAANGWRWNNGRADSRYLACQLAELDKYPEARDFVNQVDPPNTELYRHSFISPLWSADFAGFAVLFCLVLIIIIFARLISVILLRLLLFKYRKGD